MLRKSLISVMLVFMMIFAAGLAYAAHHSTNIDGLTAGPDLGGYDVYVNPGNEGDVLIGGYFNTRGMGNFFTIVNTAEGSGVIARIRFREATESEEVLDFNICLSEQDVFAGVIVDDGTQGRLFQLDSDTTLTRPDIPDTGVPFKHGGNGGLATVSADETKEGYYEVIGLVTVDQDEMDEDDPEWECPDETFEDGSANDVPNVLFGGHWLAEDGTANLFGYRMLAFANFHPFGFTSQIANENINLGSSLEGRDGVDWALTKSIVRSEYMLMNNNDPIIGDVMGESTYIVNFLTKKLNVEDVTGKFGDAQSCPDHDSEYMDTLSADPNPVYDTDELLGVEVGVTVFDENENRILSPEEFSPSQTPRIELCYEVNVIELGASNILDSNVEKSISTGTFGFGWMELDLYKGKSGHHQDSYDTEFVSLGLPAWATWLQTVNGVLSHAQEVAYETDIETD
jgi:hypothetical protein